MKILVVDDNLFNRELLIAILKQSGHEILVANNGKEALAQARQKQPDLVLMDIQMPVLNGIEAYKQMKDDTALAKIPVVAVTSHAMMDDRDKFLAEGFEDYISKPIDIDILLQIIEKFSA